MNLDSKVRHAFGNQPSGKPEPGPSSFVGRKDLIYRVAGSNSTSTIAIGCGLTSKLIWLNGALRLGLRQAWHLGRQNPVFVASQHERTIYWTLQRR